MQRVMKQIHTHAYRTGLILDVRTRYHGVLLGMHTGAWAYRCMCLCSTALISPKSLGVSQMKGTVMVNLIRAAALYDGTVMVNLIRAAALYDVDD